ALRPIVGAPRLHDALIGGERELLALKVVPDLEGAAHAPAYGRRLPRQRAVLLTVHERLVHVVRCRAADERGLLDRRHVASLLTFAARLAKCRSSTSAVTRSVARSTISSRRFRQRVSRCAKSSRRPRQSTRSSCRARCRAQKKRRS